MKYPVLFRVGVWDDEQHDYYGVIWEDSYTSAAKTLEEYYGSELIDLEMFMCEEGPIYFNKEMFEKFKLDPEAFV